MNQISFCSSILLHDSQHCSQPGPLTSWFWLSKSSTWKSPANFICSLKPRKTWYLLPSLGASVLSSYFFLISSFPLICSFDDPPTWQTCRPFRAFAPATPSPKTVILLIAKHHTGYFGTPEHLQWISPWTHIIKCHS